MPLRQIFDDVCRTSSAAGQHLSLADLEEQQKKMRWTKGRLGCFDRLASYIQDTPFNVWQETCVHLNYLWL